MAWSKYILALVLGACSMTFAASLGWAAPATVVYSEDFESLDASSFSALGPFGAGFLIFAEVWDGPVTTGAFQYLYGPFAAPNPGAGPGFSQIATGEGGPEQGLQHLNVFSDYDNVDHADDGACAPNTCAINTSVLYELRASITADDIGTRWTFTGDYKAPFVDGIGGSTTANAFIVTLDPNDRDPITNRFLATNDVRFDTTGASTTDWASFSIALDLTDPALIGQILQIGFNTRATNYEPSAVLYDNLQVNTVPIPAAAWLFGSALGLLGWMRRRRS